MAWPLHEIPQERLRQFISRSYNKGELKMSFKVPCERDLDRLARLQSLSWLSSRQLALMARALEMANFKRRQVILPEASFASHVSILLTGIARITCVNSRNERVTVALLPPGLIPQFPTLPLSKSKFQCEAYGDCRVGRLRREDFDDVTQKMAGSASKNLHENDLKQWHRLFLRSSFILNVGLRDRVAITLIELCADFGIDDARGTLLRVFFSQQDIAHLAGTSRPRVTEYIAMLEREHIVIRQGRQMIVRPAMLRHSLGTKLDRHRQRQKVSSEERFQLASN
jgi:CRP-like cAMP-binding protein